MAKFLTDFKPGDRVQHVEVKVLKGEFVRYGKEAALVYGRKCYWKGWNPFNLEAIDWTWEWAMEKETA